MMRERISVFHELLAERRFDDRFEIDPSNAVDVLIPLIHTNDLWRSNLLSVYREIPVRRLLIGDAGCIDDSIEIAREFPRVVVFDHRDFNSLGYSIRKLIEAVETEWFIYLHSDVYLPEGWFEGMKRHQSEYDWFECGQHMTILAEYPADLADVKRPYSGSQMGRKDAFRDVLPMIDDDFLYRNEDIILEALVRKAGFRYGRVDGTFHYHQITHKASPWSRKVKRVVIDVETSPDEEVRSCMMQAKGIIKYLEPSEQWLVEGVVVNVRRLLALGKLEPVAFRRWVAATNPAWLPHIRKALLRRRLRAFLRSTRNTLAARWSR
ncbi:hypothetical protein ACFLR0_00565 [Candidatus Bipolaricaulota bacterium]